MTVLQQTARELADAGFGALKDVTTQLVGRTVSQGTVKSPLNYWAFGQTSYEMTWCDDDSRLAVTSDPVPLSREEATLKWTLKPEGQIRLGDSIRAHAKTVGSTAVTNPEQAVTTSTLYGWRLLHPARVIAVSVPPGELEGAGLRALRDHVLAYEEKQNQDRLERLAGDERLRKQLGYAATKTEKRALAPLKKASDAMSTVLTLAKLFKQARNVVALLL
jgi:hypothetical protein